MEYVNLKPIIVQLNNNLGTLEALHPVLSWCYQGFQPDSDMRPSLVAGPG